MTTHSPSTRDPALIDRLRTHLGRDATASFQLMGEDSVRLTGADLALAAESYNSRLQALPPAIRESFAREQDKIAKQAHHWLTKYNRNLRTRVSGYVMLGSEFQFEYPWPVVAILGIAQVVGGLWRSRFYGLLGAAALKLRYARLEYLVEATDDILRRTNRGIFADSVPQVLYALHCHRLRKHGQAALAEALLEGPLPLTMDEECRTLVTELYRGLAIVDQDERFRFLADLTLRQFDREQAVFSHHMGVDRNQRYEPARGWLGMMTGLKVIPSAPLIEARRGKRRLAFRSYELPADFDIRNHDDRVEHFGAAFVSSVTRTLEDYVVATNFVRRQFGRGLRPAPCSYRA